MRQIEGMTSKFDEELQAFVGSLDEAAQEALYQVYDAYYDARRDDATLTMAEYWRVHGQGLMPLDLVEKLDKGETAQQEWELLDTELNERFGRDLSQYVHDEARALLTSVDSEKARLYQRWERDQMDRDWSTGLSYMLTDLTYLAERTPDSNYHQASVDFDRLEEYRKFLEEKGMLGSSDEPKESLHDRDELQRAQDLRSRYRGDFYGERIDRALEIPLLPAHDYKVKLDHEQREALERHLQSIDRDGLVDALSVEGLETLPFDLTPAGFKYMLRAVPALAFEGVDAVEFRDISSDEHTAVRAAELWGGKSVTMGHHTHAPLENSARIVLNAQEAAATYHKVLQSISNEAIARNITLDRMKKTVLHEFGHALHYKLPVTLLDTWDEAARGESVYVSAYVEQKMIHHGADQALAEDFADSFMLFLTKPEELRASSSARYAAMEEIYSMTTPPVTPDDWWQA